MKLYIGHRGEEVDCLAFDTEWDVESDYCGSIFLEKDGSVCSDGESIDEIMSDMGNLHFTELEITTEQLVKMVGLVVGGGKI